MYFSLKAGISSLNPFVKISFAEKSLNKTWIKQRRNKFRSNISNQPKIRQRNG